MKINKRNEQGYFSNAGETIGKKLDDVQVACGVMFIVFIIWLWLLTFAVLYLLEII